MARVEWPSRYDLRVNGVMGNRKWVTLKEL